MAAERYWSWLGTLNEKYWRSKYHQYYFSLTFICRMAMSNLQYVVDLCLVATLVSDVRSISQSRAVSVQHAIRSLLQWSDQPESCEIWAFVSKLASFRSSSNTCRLLYNSISVSLYVHWGDVNMRGEFLENFSISRRCVRGEFLDDQQSDRICCLIALCWVVAALLGVAKSYNIQTSSTFIECMMNPFSTQVGLPRVLHIYNAE